jgi:CHAT domain-containing protein/Tfp pilus assembly protein PilF
LLLAAALLGAGPAAAAEEPAFPLAAGSAVRREIAPGERHAYAVRGRAGDFLHVEVEPAAADVALAVLDRSGAPLLELDDPVSPSSPETLFLLLPDSGEVRLVVRSAGPPPPGGGYELRVEALRPPGETDRLRAAALALTARGIAAHREETAEAARRTVDLFAEAAPLWRRAGDRGREVMALNFVGYHSAQLGETARAQEAYGQAIAIAAAEGLEPWEARSRQHLGELFGNLGEWEQALDELNRALPTFRRLGDRLAEAVVLIDIGQAHSEAGDLERALEVLGEAITAARAAGSLAAEATARHNIASIHGRREEYWRALEEFREALAMSEEAGTRRDVAATLNQIAWVFDMLGEKERALDAYQQVLAILREVGARQWEAIALGNVGGVHLALGDLPRARDAYAEALEMSREAGDRRGEAGHLSCLGRVHAAMGEAAEARRHFVEALAIRRAIGDRVGTALTLRHLARLDAAEGRADAAREAYLEVLATARELEIPGFEAAAHDGLAGLALARGELDAALDAAETAIALGETLRTRIPGEDLRTSLFAGFVAHHRRAIEVLMARHRLEPGRGWDERALAVAERSRARSLLDALAGGGGGTRGAEDGPGERAEEARRRLAEAAFALYRLERDAAGGPQVAAQQARVRALLADYKEAAARARAASWRAGAPADLDDAWRRETLDAGTLLLEVSLGERESWLWAITRSGVTSYPLPPAAELEAAARRLYDLATARNRPDPPAAQARLAADAADRSFAREAAALSRVLLGPVAELPGARRLVFVADGALHLVPLAALPLPGSEGAAPPAEPLASRYEVVALPSASLLTALRARRRAPSGGPTLAVFADPVFGPDDPRLSAANGSAPDGDGARRAGNGASPAAHGTAAESDLARAAAEVGLTAAGPLPRLPYTGREAAALARLVPPEEAWVALGFDAARERVTSPEVTAARILHFATHGFANGTHPQLSGIVLSLRDRHGRERDGFLRLAEISALELRAELVVLSSCRTAVGRTVAGEGALSLARGFLEAGAAGVVATLWPVDEVATARFMERFYAALLGEGLAPAAALRRAQLELRREPRWRAPHYWAAFVLEGDWR